MSENQGNSSSFIIGIGELPNQELIDKARKYLKKVYIGKIEDLVAEYAVEVEDDNTMYIESFTDDRVELDIKPDMTYIVIRENGNEGDGCFYQEDEDGYPDYDIDIDFFGEEDQEIFNFIRGLENSDITFGAGRDG